MNKRITVLVIDDDAFIRKTLEHYLWIEGFEVYSAKNGRAGLKMARKKQLELILLDWTMKGMNGLEVLSHLKHDEKTEHIPVFMMTAKGTMDDIEKAYDIGADNYITKPFDPNRLGKRLKTKLQETRPAQVK
ncbi:MAG: response regulator [Planctomycetota bacterium]|jgi:DNA-binding response OmpR family regulator